MKKQILVVDDNLDSREMLSFILIGEGFSVLAAEDGLQALELVKDAQPDLIITDINMPNLDGIELTKQLRRKKRGFRASMLQSVTHAVFLPRLKHDRKKRVSAARKVRLRVPRRMRVFRSRAIASVTSRKNSPTRMPGSNHCNPSSALFLLPTASSQNSLRRGSWTSRQSRRPSKMPKGDSPALSSQSKHRMKDWSGRSTSLQTFGTAHRL